MSVAETIKIAHTARCKLQLAADRPDRNLRFILGHAFTLDKLRLRIAEIEEEEEEEEEEEDIIAGPTPAEQRRVSFSGKTKQRNNGAEGRRSPPPPPQLEDDLEEDEDEDLEEDDEEDEGLGLQRFGSAAAQPPRIVGEESSSSDEDEEPTNPSMFSEDQLKTITNRQGNEELKDAYKKMYRCSCHGENGPAVENFWDMPAAEQQKPGLRRAVVQVSV